MSTSKDSTGAPALKHVDIVRRLFPETPPTSPVTSKLSIIDATVGRFSPTAAIWLYDKPTEAEIPHHRLFDTLTQALGRTLNDYPHFAGQIQWASESMVKDDDVPRHLGRPVVVHGAPTDPGVEVVIASHDMRLDEVVPGRDERATRLKEWNASDFRQADFLPDTKTALSSLNALEGLPAVAVQLTAFRCGGFGVSAKMAHPLADAVTLTTFMHSWAARSRILFGNGYAAGDLDVLKPVFNPAQLDQVAGLRPGSPPDPDRVAKARSLPMHRFDWWAEDAPGYPQAVKPATLATMPPPDELATTKLSPSTFPPWPTWDMAAAVDHVQIRFAADELARMREAAQASLPDDLKSLRISRLDAALAHIWTLMNRARGFQGDRESVYVNITLGLRNRVSPPLPDTFVGSPLLLGYVEKTADEGASRQLGPVAGAIRQMMSRFTPDAVAAYIHDAAHEVSPQRLWQGFPGTRHTIVTSWVRARTYELDFLGSGGLARYVQGVMPKIDGLVQIMDVADTGDFDVSVCMQRDAMGRLLKDSFLRQYEK
ncbi:transferase [Colletotrichum higginsianum]|uniref:Transferase n=1 Tax=Colletotrichum higginsianum (strain IMI 349063) TaxID=759273 RepID=H1V5G2_COLHI|nr:Transferase [Colletotrichum higginsianum IMI 349063]OBR12851.1 Transferase [Colletotrichum higginsianum IMI 349063]CCF35464.1 transferase [Colletotrichum higginsianum]